MIRLKPVLQNQSLILDNFNQSISCNIEPCQIVKDLRKAADAHRQVRHFLQSYIKQDMYIYDICESLEEKTRNLLGDSLQSGIGFSTSLSLNHVAAHDSATPFDKRTLKRSDVCKIDFGTHVNGNIIDCAFTVCFDPKYETLLDAANESMWAAIQMAGSDAYINDISQTIQEVIESYELEENGTLIPIYSSRILAGHTINPYTIHGGKSVFNCPRITNRERMVEGECYAIETFPQTKSPYMYLDEESELCHFGLKDHIKPVQFDNSISKELYNYICSTRDKLPFCTRWLYSQFGIKYKDGIDELLEKNIVKPYYRISGPEKCMNAQYEHTIYIHSTGKEVISYGNDF
jgi:methionyl aminopeptidase